LALVERYREEGMSLKDASRQAASETGLNRKALYDAALGK
jgi:16S rRNA C1402 (ribose-2'-O) methylase RsmI